MAVVLIFFLLPKESSAASNSIPYDGVKVTTTVTGFNLGNWSDGELSTSNTLKKDESVYLDLPEEYTITGHSIVSDTSSNNTVIQFFDAANKVIAPGVGYAGTNQSYLYKNVKRIRVYNGGTSWKITELNFHSDKVIYEPVVKITETHTHDTATFRWEIPKDPKFDGVLISKDGFNIADLPKTSTSLVVRDLEPNTVYKFSFVTKFNDGTVSDPMRLEVLTSEAPPPPKPADDVKELRATADYNRVDLSWNLPASENFKHVNIYRYEVQQTALIDKVLMIKTASAAAAGKKIFETNGTYFNDLTVNPETTYQYTLTTTSTDLLESVGVSKTVTTPEKPKQEIEGGEFEKDPATGSYIYRWTEPTTGKVKVMVGGKLYTTVNASNKVVVIPAKDMKFKGLDEPDVYLIPVSEDGEEGTPVKPPAVGGGTGGMLDDIDLPFNAGELLGTGTGLFWLIGPFVLLALAFLLVPKLRNSMVHAFTGNKDALTDTDRRSRDVTERAREERMRVAREREVNTTREPIERQQRAVRASRERVHKARMSREERRTT